MMKLSKAGKYLLLFLLGVSTLFMDLKAESGIYDRIGIISEHGLHGAVPEENIDLFTGNLTLKNLDIHLPGPNGFNLDIWRVYNSKILKDRLMGSGWGIQQEPYSWVGFGWSLHMGRLHAINSETPVIEYPDGRWETAYHDIDNYTTFITRDFVKLDKSNWKLYFKDGTVWTFGVLANIHYANMVTEQVRVVTQITNSYGHQINITYDATGSPRLKTITDSMGRTVTFIIDAALGKLERIDVKNATGSTVSYFYTVDEFNGDFYKLTRFDPPLLPAVTYEYESGLASNWELLAVNTSYGGRMEYEYSDQTFYYQVYALQTKVIREKRIKFGSNFKTWTYSYPSYYNSATGTVTVTGPAFITYATYHAYTSATPWKIGLINEKSVSDNSFSEQYEWTAKTISDTRWYVLNIDMGQAAAPLMKKTTRNRSGDSISSEEYLYERTETNRYGLPTRINVYGGGSLKNYRTLKYYFEDHSTFTNKGLVGTETLRDNSATTLKQTIISYMANGAVDSVQKWKSGSTYLTWNYGYTSSNPNLITITIDQPGNGGTETMTYKYGVLATLTRPGYTEYTRTISSYNSCILSETNQHGGVMNFSYDSLGRITSISMPAGFNNISASWSTNSVSIAQGSNTVTKYWDGMGRDTGYMEQGDGIVLYHRKSLDSEGRIVAESKGSTASADTFDYVFNAAGQIKKITDPLGKITTISLSGDQKTVTDANSHATKFEYNHLPGLVSILTDPAGKTATFSYDGAGGLLNTRFNSNRTQSYAYNGLDQIISEIHPETGTIVYEYSTANNLETKTWGGTSTAYSYNTSNQVLTENAEDETLTYTYDTKGRAKSITSSMGWSKTSITYNSFGAVTQEIVTIPGLSAKTISYSYDLNNQLKDVTYPDGRKAAFTNNGLNLPETIAFNASTLVNAITYGIGKQPTLITISGNGTSYVAAYNKNGNLSSAQLKKSSTLLYDADYAYDGVGNVTTLNNSTPALNAGFSYDVRNHLNGASYTPSGVGRVNNVAYTYDDYGNMTRATENGSTVFSQSYTAKNQIDSFTFDSRGNLTSNPLYNYSWDNRNRLSQITSKLSGESEGTYAYDEKGMRLKAVRPVPPSISITTPNGNESWLLDSLQSINWNSTNTSANITLELLQGGITLGVIAENIPVAAGSYSWTAGQYSGGSAAAGIGYAIKITTSDGACTDSSDNPFQLLDGRLTLLSPNGGESWTLGTQQPITWSVSAPAGNFDLALFNASGKIGDIATGLTSDQRSFSWTVGSYIGGTTSGGTDFQVRVADGAGNSDTGDAVFTILAPTGLRVISPNGGEELILGQSFPITWSAIGVSQTVKLVLYKDGNKVGIIAKDLNAGSSPYNWTVGQSDAGTAAAGGGYQIRLRTMDNALEDYSDAAFTLKATSASLRVVSPNGGEELCLGQSFPITWTATGVSQKVKLVLYRNGSKVGIIAQDLNAGSSPYNWTVGQSDAGTAAAGSGYQIRLRTMDNAIEDYSDAAFSLKTCTGLQVNFPNGGDFVLAGSLREIRWSGGKDILELKIECSTDLGSTYHLIADRAPNTGSYSWPVPETISDHCLVRISDANGRLASENTVLECELAFAIKGTEGMETTKPFLSLWLEQPMLTEADPHNSCKTMPLLSLTPSELDSGYQLNFGEYSTGLEDASSLFEKPQRIKVQWDIMNSRGSLYLDQKPVFRDIPLPSDYDQDLSPCLVLRAGEGISALQVDDLHVNLVMGGHAGSGTIFSATSPSADKNEASYLYTPLILDDFESYKQEESIANGGWSASFVLEDKGLQAGSGQSGQRQKKARLAIDSFMPVSGLQSGKAVIPVGTSLILTKPISWPERVPFAVSAKPFSIIQANEIEADCEKDAHIHPEKDVPIQAIDEENDENLKGPNAGTPATTTPLIGRATLYTTTYYIHSFDGKLLAEYDASGVCQKDYIYMGNKLLAEYQPVIAKYYYYTSDQINSTRIITNSSGTVVYSAVFDPYGGMQKEWVNTFQPSLKFSGKERESGSGLDYFGARYYDHMRYRFISVDPVINKDEALINPQLWNLYAYCRNNPVTYIDPDGRWSKPIHNKIIDDAFSSGKYQLPENIRNIFKEASAYVDTDQSLAGSYKHAMRAPWQTPAEAEKQMGMFITKMKAQYRFFMSKGKKYEAYFALGMAMHALMDSTSPTHEGYQEWNGIKLDPSLIKTIKHPFGETDKVYESNSGIQSKSIELLRSYINETKN